MPDPSAGPPADPTAAQAAAPAAMPGLAGILAGRLAGGLPQDAATIQAVCAALGRDDPAEALALLAADPDAAEHAPLVSLLLSPDRALMLDLEPDLARAGLAQAGRAQSGLDETGLQALGRELAALLAGRRVALLLPGGGRAELPAGAAELLAFVRRLRPWATAPAELREIAARRFGAETGLTLAVQLRHCRLAWTPAREFFLAELLERADPAMNDLPGLLGWATGFLADAGEAVADAPALRQALAARRQALQVQLRQAEAQEQALARGSYELLMSQGLRLAHAHAPELEASLVHLGRFARLVLGLAEADLDRVAVRDLGRAEGVEEAFRLLHGG